MRRTLFIDIDGTLINEAPLPPEDERIRDYALLAVVRDFAVQAGRCTATEATRIIENLLDTRTWWDWQDFLTLLELDPAEFWKIADARAAQTLHPVEANLDLKLERLSLAGCRLCITSNNPSSGIRHKLRLAGLTRGWQRRHIERVFGTDVVGSMKWDRPFWEHAIELADTPVGGITVVGNDWHDDVLVPWAEGIRHFVFLNLFGEPDHPTPEGATVHRVTDWAQAVERLFEPTRQTQSVAAVSSRAGEARA